MSAFEEVVEFFRIMAKAAHVEREECRLQMYNASTGDCVETALELELALMGFEKEDRMRIMQYDLPIEIAIYLLGNPKNTIGDTVAVCLSTPKA